MQAVVLAAVDGERQHVLLDGGNRRQEALAVEAVGVQLFGRLVGGGDHRHPGGEDRLQQRAEQHGVADVADEQFVKTQHAHFRRQLAGQRLQRVGRAGELEQAAVHPAHEMVEVLASRRDAQAVVEAVHQPGLAAPDRPPQVHPARRRQRIKLPMQGLMAGFQLLHGLPLRCIGDEAVLVDGLPVGGQGRDDIQRVHGRGFPCCSGRAAGDSRGHTGVAAAPQCTASHTVGCPAAVASTRWRTPAGISR
ncbi:hypothetical protein D3C80_1200000 [compost metagenome]